MLIRLRYWTALLVTGGLAFGVSHLVDRPSDADNPSQQAAATPLADPAMDASGDDVFVVTTPPKPAVVLPETAADTVTWSRVVDEGGSFSGLLAQAGLDTDTSRAVTAALGSEFDFRHLKAGQRLSLQTSPAGELYTAALELEDGSRILARFLPAPSVERLAPDLVSFPRAGEATVTSSIFGALDAAGIPTRFATDLELVLAETFDLRTKLSGGEHLRIMWREYRAGDRVVGEPTIDFAELDLADGRYEIMWPDDNSRRTQIMKDGKVLHSFEQPIRGARLSSSFGMRHHPVLNTNRMHSGVDLAAAQGAPVEATQDGKVAYMGQRSGYGTVVEVDHGSGVMTRYAHLSALSDAIKVGDRVTAGTELGLAGSTGISTAPHLHYEIRINGMAVSPLADTRLRELGGNAAATNSVVRLSGVKSKLDRLLAVKG
ncbi:peptidoglycan DD-metalloendopeptidase family protein [Loktanella sp. R86503]|uniref:peptidoglycan DD-metalloendopeptidase family protein n=1 Tax=Loktanella sp. R86503 TaxID=3093847 RepID=UPI0036DEE5F1